MRAFKTSGEYVLLDIGTLDIPAADALMQKLVTKRQHETIPDMLLFLSYVPCLAVGARQLNENDFLKPQRYFKERGITLYKTARGGGLTYHWPGQLVTFPIVKLQANEQNIPSFMRKLEEIGLRTLAEVGITAHRKREETAQIGLWVGDDKIASMGIRISRWVTSYGFALNLSGDISVSRYIRPCGLDVKLVTVEALIGRHPSRDDVKEKIRHNFEKIFQRRQITCDKYSAQIKHIVNKHSATAGGNQKIEPF
ncbi:lipoyl(octanoyl) transferase [candidate division KSB1 bacterium]|nr:lipoyl(octanoyl) transferase LipB [candidate division KSB1 bacterium]RQW00571.1 MAG: lipoyl(octanoyl) transferase [candidate division KSB1 bacterium]